jgi:dihydroorotate dehydrogenase
MDDKRSSVYPFFRSVLFRLDPERAHSLTLGLLRLVGILPPLRELLHLWFHCPSKPVEVFGLQFSNPVGLAAGYDKDGLSWRGLACLGFGHIEIGTVTRLPQKGNPRPRLFRLLEDQGLINRMGFPGRGAEFLKRRLPRNHPGLILGVNIGKNRDTPLELAAQDYIDLMRKFAPLADYLVVNVSSPNTEGLRRLQGRTALEKLLYDLYKESMYLDLNQNRHVPLLVKLAPDLTDKELEDALEVIVGNGVDGVIATNTTIQREGLRSPYAHEKGGLSGKPLHHRSLEMVRSIYQLTDGKLPIIGVGGIDSPQSAMEMLDAGAKLVQIYTGLIYRGPSLVRDIIKNLDYK